MVVRTKFTQNTAIRSAIRPVDSPVKMLAEVWRQWRRQSARRCESGLVRNEDDDRFAAGVVSQTRPDVVNLHWLGEGFMGLRSLAKIKSPIVWTLHDMWALTGGCTYSGGCERFSIGCGECPLAGEGADRSAGNHAAKRRIVSEGRHAVACPSRWMADRAERSAIFRDVRVEVVPNSVDTDLFRPMNSTSCREVCGLPFEPVLMLFGSSGGTGDRRKGFDLLEGALNSLRGTDALSGVELVVFGRRFDARDLPVPVHFLGEIRDERFMPVIYGACDLLVVPSREDNLPNTMVESIACGTPVIGFPVGGIPDLVRERETGFMAEEVSASGLAMSLSRALIDRQRLASLRTTARDCAVRELAMPVQAAAYEKLYSEMLA